MNIPLLNSSERHQLLVEWNDTVTDFPQNKCIHQLFEEQVQRSPESVAVVFENQQLTYGDLNTRANQLAHHLRDLGVGPEVLVGICVERSLELVIGLLGILKAGGAYVPLDPEYPSRRLAFMLQDTRATVLLTQDRLQERLPSHPAQVVCLDTDSCRINQHSEANLPSQASPDNLAYVIYTSGSEGTPKGVAIQHAAIARLVFENDYAKFGPDRVFLQLATVSFDASTFELWGSLLHGAKLVVAPSGLPDFRQLEDLVKRNQVTTLWLTATLLNQVVDLYPQALNSVDEILSGGEALSVRHIRKARAALGSRVQLVNGYGPTESTTFAVCYRIPSSVAPDVQSIPIGRPIVNTQAYVLDEHRNPVPIGVPGELYIGGLGLARGYWNRPELTAERFIANPFSDNPGSRLYKTGDLCRWLPDGNLEFLGRIDQQVKIRGYRIEPGEVESALLACDRVREAAVLAREDRPGEKRLVAYVVPTTGLNGESDSLSVRVLREHLQASLPKFMLPSTFVFLHSLPLMRNGKLDRKALPAPKGRLTMEGRYVPPRNPLEEQLCAIWQAVLGLDRVGVHDNFFELGGHSLLATQVISRVRRAFDVELPLAELFRRQTVAEFAQSIEPRMQAGETISAPPLVAQPRKKVVPLSFAQQRLWFLDQLLPESPQYNLPRAWRVRGNLDREALQQAFRQIVRRHAALRTRFESVQGQPRQVIDSDWNEPTLFYEDFRALGETERDAEIDRRAREEASRPFDLSLGPLLRVFLWQLKDDEHVLYLNVHHIVYDGWSMAVLKRELSVLYAAYSQGATDPLPPLTLQFSDYAIWQRGWLREEVLAAQLDYWRRELSGAEVLQLPTDHPRPVVSSCQGAAVDLELSAELTQRLKQLSLEHGVSLFMLLLSAWKLLLSRHSGQDDIVVGTPIANRTQVETEDLIGFFVNTLPLRSDLSGNPRFVDLLAQVRERTLAAYAHQDVPLEQLVDSLDLERDLSRTPLFQVFFNMVNVERPRLSLKDLTLKTLPVRESMPLFDLTLYVREHRRELDLHLVYRTDLFDQPRMNVVLRQYEHVLRQIVEVPERRLNEICLITPDCRTQLPDPTAILEEPEHKPITETLEAIAGKFPDHPAVTQAGKQWTYGKLWSRAEHVARSLCALGVKPGEVIAVIGPKSFGLITAMLGIELSGGVLMPLDSHLPRECHETMLRQAGAKTIVTVRAGRDADYRATNQWPLQTIWLDADEGLPEERSPRIDLAGVKLPRICPDCPAHVFFTSGSTGRPKGILGSHKGLSQFLAWQRERFEIGTQDRVAQLTSLSFDVVLRDVFLPLTSGATLCLPARDDFVSSGQVIPWLEQEGITVLHSVPSLIRHWLSFAEPGRRYTSVRWLFSVGEPLTDSLVRSWREVIPSGQIVNLYGLTETGMAKCFHVIPEEPAPGVQPVGRPLPQTQALVLRSDGARCGIGERGEIVLRTPFGTLGYLDSKDRDRGGFVVNPFRDDPSYLLYKTGDRGRYRPDGALEILGRMDDQVKIHGVRVEPNEVAAVLAQHPRVRMSAVLTHQDERKQFYLAAYVVPATDLASAGDVDKTGVVVDTLSNITMANSARLTEDSLQSYLQSRLPVVMVPRTITFMKSMPVLPNGKVDRQALPEPEYRASLDRPYVPPRNPLEAQICGIWQEVLGVDRVGIHDNFFHLGGHSLLAVTLMARMEELTGNKLPISTLFQAPSVRCLAEVLGEENGRPRWTALVPVQPLGSRLPLFLVPPAASSGMRFVTLSHYLGNDQPVYSFDLIGEDGQEIPLNRVEDIAAQFVREMITLQPRGPYLVGGRCFGAHVAYEMAQQLSRMGKEATVLVLDANPPHNGPDWYWQDWRDRRFAFIRRAIHHLLRGSFINVIAARVPGSRLNRLKKRLAKAGPLQCHMRARRNYCAKPIDGNVAVFLSSQFNHPEVHERWASLALGSFSNFVISGSSHHSLLQQESEIRRLAELIQSFLKDHHAAQKLD